MTLTDTELEALLAEREPQSSHWCHSCDGWLPCKSIDRQLAAAVPDLLRRLREWHQVDDEARKLLQTSGGVLFGIEELLRERDAARRYLADLRPTLLSAEHANTLLGEESERLRKQLANARLLIAEQEKSLASFRQECDRLGLELGDARKDLADAVTRANRAEADAAACRIDAVSTDDDRVETLLEELAKARAELARLRAGTNP